MAIKIPIITELQDEGIKRAKREFDKFKGAVAKAEGGMGKFKAGSKAILDGIQANAANFATAAAGAFVTFAAQGVTAFQELALSADKFAGATGLAVEEASRLMEVAGDLGIESGTVETAIGKMNQNLGKSPDLFKQLGVQVAYAKDGTVDANETFLNVIDRLNKIKDPAEKARVATQLLGKGWRDMSQLIGMGADELRASLAGVSDAKVIDPAEVEKAKKFRDAMDNLKDIFEDISIELGESLVPVLADVAEIMADMNQLANVFEKIPGVKWWQENLGYFPGITLLTEGIEGVTGAAKELWHWINPPETKLITDEEVRNMRAARDDLDEFNQAALNQINLGKKDVFGQISESANRLKTELDNVRESWDMLTGKLDAQVALDRAEQALLDLEEAAAKAFGGGSQEDMRVYNEEAAKFAGLLASIAGGMGDISSREIQIRFKTSGPAAALDLAKWLASGAELKGMSQLDLLGFAGISTIPRAMGGTVSAGSTYLVGERGPELLKVGAAGGHITPNHALGGGNNTINVTVTSADPNEVVRALQQYVRQSGPVPVNTRTM